MTDQRMEGAGRGGGSTGGAPQRRHSERRKRSQPATTWKWRGSSRGRRISQPLAAGGYAAQSTTTRTRICDAVDEVEGSNSIRPAAQGETLDDEAPAAMAAGGEASSSAPGGETVLGRRVRGEAFDDEAPTVMAEGDEASSSAPPAAKRNRGRKRAGKQAKMNHHQRHDMTERRA